MINENIGVKGYVTVEVIRKDGTVELVCEEKPNLMTTVGIDFMHAQMYSTSLSANGANYIGLSCDSAAPSVSDTALTGEILVNGLQRDQGVVTHVAGTQTTTIVKTFTAGGSFTGVQKTALFNASFGGQMVHENSFSATNLESGDLIRITWNIIST